MAKMLAQSFLESTTVQAFAGAALRALSSLPMGTYDPAYSRSALMWTIKLKRRGFPQTAFQSELCTR
jgi:hypothetical protein